MKKVSVIALASLIFAAVPASAGTIIASSYSNAASFGPGVNTGSTAAFQKFTLTTSVTIGSIDADLSLEGPAETVAGLTMTIVSDSAGAPGTGTTYGTDTSVSGTLSSSGSDVNFVFASAALSAGSYWLELTDSGAGVTWLQQTSGITNPAGSGGSINNNVFCCNFSPRSETLLTTINGPSSAPEPGTVLTFCGGLAAVLYLRVRRGSASGKRV